MDPVVHFEMPYDQADRLQKFYRAAFGWELNNLGEQMGDYVLAVTTESSDTGPLKPGTINGGFYARMPEMPDQCPSVVISVDDLRASMEKVTAGGGTVNGEPMEIPGIGLYVSIQDTEGNRVGMLQPAARAVRLATGRAWCSHGWSGRETQPAVTPSVGFSTFQKEMNGVSG